MIAMLSNRLSARGPADRLPSSVPRIRVVFLNLSAERCLTLARYPVDWPAASQVSIRYDDDSVLASMDWTENELAALNFEERLPDAVFNRFARSFIRLESLVLGNAHAGKCALAPLVSPEMKERLWRGWSKFEGMYLMAQTEPGIEAI